MVGEWDVGDWLVGLIGRLFGSWVVGDLLENAFGQADL